MKTNRIVLSLIAAIALGGHSASSATLTFDSATPGTIADGAGLGTGFTHRLPGSGSGIPANDSNLSLDTANGRLLVTSTRADFNATGFGRNLAALDAPSFLLSGIGTQDFEIEAHFFNINVDDLSDQIGVFAGASVDNLIRGGAIEGGSGQYNSSFVYSFNGTDQSPSGGVLLPAFHDAIFELGRISGTWYFRWQILDTPTSGSVNFTAPSLDSQTDLYVGIFNNDARNFTPRTVSVDYVAVVPEPTSAVLLLCGAAFCLRRRTRPPQSLSLGSFGH